MNYDSELIKKILLEIKKHPKKVDKTIYISGYGYNDAVFPCLLWLHKEKYLNGNVDRDEANEPVQILVTNLTAEGEKYLKKLSDNNSI